MIEARYDRTLDASLVEHLKIGGQLEFLLHGIPVPFNEPYALDVQIRENNKIMYYRGTTRLLVITLRTHNDALPTFTVAADKFYAHAQSCADAFVQLKERGRISPADTLVAFREYLSAAIRIAPAGHYDNHAEGYWQNRICYRFGRGFCPEDEWLVFDRECVIGFKNKGQKAEFYGPIWNKYEAACASIRRRGKDRWRDTNLNKGLGDELDMLAVDRDGNLLAIELKFGRNANGIYWGPVQVGVYRNAFLKQLATLGPSVAYLIEQKVQLGLLPPCARMRCPDGGFQSVVPVLAVAKVNPSSGCWAKLAEVMDHVGMVDVVTVDSQIGDSVELPDIQSRHISLKDG